MQEIFSIFTITERNGKIYEGEAIEGFGQDVMKWIRKQYPRYTKFVLEGYEIGGTFRGLYMRTKNQIT